MFKIGDIVRYKDGVDLMKDYYALVLRNSPNRESVDVLWLHKGKIAKNCPYEMFESMEKE